MTAARAASLVAAGAETGGSRGTHAAPPAEADLFAAFEDELDGLGGALAPPKKRGAGRPPGSVNRTTLQLQRFLAARGVRDPAIGLALIASADPVTLGDALCKGIDGLKPEHRLGAREKALAIIERANTDLMAYFHQKAPVRVEVDGAGAENRTLIVIGQGPTQVNVGQVEKNQGVTVEGAIVSDGDMSDEGRK